MSTSTDLAPVSGGGQLVTRDYLNERRELIREQLAPGASDAEMELLIETAVARGLNPVTRQIYGVMRWDGRKQKEVMSIQTGIDGFRLVAQRTGEYAGQVGPEWCGTDGVWKDVWLDQEPPAAARVGVYRTGFTVPVFAVALYEEYVARNKKGETTGQWKTMPALMTAKCAEALALRKAFPEDLSGLYTNDEMAQAGNPAPQATATAGAPAPQRAKRASKEDMVAERQRSAQTRAARLGIEDYAAFFGGLGVDHPNKLASDAVWKRVNDELRKREADDIPLDGEITHEGDDDPVITEAQRKRLEAIAKELGRDHAWMTAIAGEAGFASSTEIRRSHYDDFERVLRETAAQEDAA